MPYAYYASLSRQDKATYRKSDRLSRVNLKKAEDLWPFCTRLNEALDQEQQQPLGAAA